MGLSPNSLTYVFPAPLLPTGVLHHVAPRHSRRPPSFTVWQPHPCTTRFAASLRRPPLQSPEGDNAIPNDASREKPPASWRRLKTWFSPDTAPNRQPSAASEDPDANVNVTLSSPPSQQSDGDSLQGDSVPSISSAGDQSNSSSRFRWPWHRDPQNPEMRQTDSSSNGSNDSSQAHHPRSSQKSSPPDSKKPAKKRVKHSDSKPGPTLDIEENRLRTEQKVSWQQRWKSAVDVIIPNLPKRIDQKSKKEEQHQQDSKRQQGSKTSSDDGTSGSKKRSVGKQGGSDIRSTIFDLYRPPKSRLKSPENTQKSKPWFTPPWVRDSKNGTVDPSFPTVDSGDASNDAPQDRSDVPSGTVGKAYPTLDDSEREVRKAAADSHQEWFTPPWKRVQRSPKSPTADVSVSSDKTALTGDLAEQTDVPSEDEISSEEETSFSSDAQGGEQREGDDKKPESVSHAEKKWFKRPAPSNDRNIVKGSSAHSINSRGEHANKPVSVDENPTDRSTAEELTPTKSGDSNTEENGRSEKNGFNDEKSSLKRHRSARPERVTSLSSEGMTFPQRDIANIRLIFGSETFFATDAVSAPGGLIFRGNLRGEPKATLAKLEGRLRSRFGDKYTLCLAEGDEDRRPVVVVIPSAYYVKSLTPRQRLMAIGVAMMTVSTCFSRGLTANMMRKRILAAHGPPPLNSILDKLFYHPLSSTVTMACAIAVVILVSQLVQRSVAAFHRTRIAMPFVLPSFHLGSFGAVVHVSSPAPTRSALFDIAVSGAASLVVLSLTCLVIGLRLSTTFPSVLPVPMSMVSSSMVMGFLTKQIPNGRILVDYNNSLIGLHPLAIIGANCLTIAALNMLPIRLLDGGRIIAALYGRKVGLGVSKVAVLFLLLASSKSPHLIVFLLAVSFGPWYVDRPSKNELTEPNSVRTIVGYLFMLLMIGILLPYPKSPFFGTM